MSAPAHVPALLSACSLLLSGCLVAVVPVPGQARIFIRALPGDSTAQVDAALAAFRRDYDYYADPEYVARMRSATAASARLGSPPALGAVVALYRRRTYPFWHRPLPPHNLQRPDSIEVFQSTDGRLQVNCEGFGDVGSAANPVVRDPRAALASRFGAERLSLTYIHSGLRLTGPGD